MILATEGTDSQILENAYDFIGDSTNTDVGAVSKFLKDFPEQAMNFGIKIVLCLLFFYIGTRVIRLLLKMIRKSLDRTDADDGIKTFTNSFLKATFYVVLVFIILSAFGVNTTSVAALLGSAGVAIGLAVQGSLSNFAGGVLLLILKPFKVGDYILEDTNKNEGIVTDIQIFYTKLKTAEGRMVVLPNGDLANTSLTNYSSDYFKVSTIKIGISYKADLKKAKEILMKVMQKEPKTQKHKSMSVNVVDLADSAVILSMTCQFHLDDYYKGRSNLLENAKLALDEANIEIPYQQIDICIKNNN